MITMHGSVNGATSDEVRARVDACIPGEWSEDQKELMRLLTEYDHANAPSNWEPRYHQEQTMRHWAADLVSRNPELVTSLLKAWRSCDTLEAKAEACGQFGAVSNGLYSEMMDYFC